MASARLFFLALAAGLAGLVVWALGADGRGLAAVLAAMFAEPWTVVTLADLYLGFVIAAAAILLAERRLAVGLAWALPVFVLGNIWTAIWVALRLPRLARRLRSGA